MRSRRFPWWLLLVPALALAQDWRGDGRVHGRVLSADGSPAAGALVRLQLGDLAGPPEVETDDKGRFSVAGLAPGAWTVSIDLVGHIVSRGRITLAPGGAAPVEVRLRSLDEVSPLFSEGDVSAVAEWVDKGNSFLRDGRLAEARAEYERALGELPWREHAGVLQGIARTYYLEGQVPEALEQVRRALSIEPRNEELRGLARGLFEALGRAGEVPAFLDGLPAEPREPAAPARSEAEGAEEQAAPAWPERPLLDPEPHRTGRFRLRLDRRSALSTLEEYGRRYGAEAREIRSHDPAAGDYGIAGESFEVYVPATYDPETAHGVLVWVSPTPFGGTERPEIQKLLDERGVLWIGANRSGNERSRWDRTGLALDAAEAMRRLYHVDPARVWVGGYSGGGRVASGLALLWSEVFRGGLFVMGCDFYRELPVSYVPGASWPASFRAPPARALRGLRAESRFVVLTGSRDFNLSRSRSVYGGYLDEGFRRVSLLEVPGISHYDVVPVEWWARALDFLDGTPPGPR